jgi:hypothetical protein
MANGEKHGTVTQTENTENREKVKQKRKIMKNTKTTLAIVAALAAGASTQLYAATTLKAKEDVITFTLTQSRQESISTSASKENAGDWTQLPFYYKAKMPGSGAPSFVTKNVIQDIAYVLHGNNAYYDPSAVLVLDQGELSGFFALIPGDSTASVATANYTDGVLDGTFDDGDNNETYLDLNDSTESLTQAFPNGRHDQLNPLDGASYEPVGHVQPWGQIWVKDIKKAHYDNVTYFFAISVQECYDCFYMNSFISQATFKLNTKTAPQQGPPCCNKTTTSAIVGSGKDMYYMTLSFDNTENNPYLYPDSSCYVGVEGLLTSIPGDGIVPDALPYEDAIDSALLKDSPYEARFTLNGIMTYTWNLAFISGGEDVAPEFVGRGTLAANGYGFIGLYCSLLTGTVNFTERVVNYNTTVDALWYAANDSVWLDWWYGVGAEYVSTGEGGYETAYVYYLALNEGDLGAAYANAPKNVSTSLSYHDSFNTIYPANLQDFAPAAWPFPSFVPSLYWNTYTGYQGEGEVPPDVDTEPELVP